MGLTGYYRKFVKDYGKLARPLINLLKKNNFVWSDQATKAFEKLKQKKVIALVLQLLDFSKFFVIECCHNVSHNNMQFEIDKLLQDE